MMTLKSRTKLKSGCFVSLNNKSNSFLNFLFFVGWDKSQHPNAPSAVFLMLNGRFYKILHVNLPNEILAIEL